MLFRLKRKNRISFQKKEISEGGSEIYPTSIDEKNSHDNIEENIDKLNIGQTLVENKNKNTLEYEQEIVLEAGDIVVQYGNDSIEINGKKIINLKQNKVIHPNPEIQDLIDSIAGGTVYQIKDEEKTLDQDFEEIGNTVEVSVKEESKERLTKEIDEDVEKVETFALGLKKNIKGYDGSLADVIKYVPVFYQLFESLLKEKRFDDRTRWIINSVVAYFVLPDDVIPEDKFGPIGYIDDLYLCVFVLDKLKAEKETILKYWLGEEDLYDLAFRIKDIIESTPNDIVGKEKLQLTVDYLKPMLEIYKNEDVKEPAIEEVRDEKSVHVVEDKSVDKNNIFYNDDLYYVREEGSFIQLIDKKYDFPILTLDKKNHSLIPGKTDTILSDTENVPIMIKEKHEIKKTLEVDSQSGKEVIEYDINIFSLKKEGNYFLLVGKGTNQLRKTYNEKYYIVRPKENEIFGSDIKKTQSPDEDIKRINVTDAMLLKDSIEKTLSNSKKLNEETNLQDHDMDKILLKRKCICLSAILDIYINEEKVTAFPNIEKLKDKLGGTMIEPLKHIIKDSIYIDPTQDQYVKIGFIGFNKKTLRSLENRYKKQVISLDNDERSSMKSPEMKQNVKNWNKFKSRYK